MKKIVSFIISFFLLSNLLIAQVMPQGFLIGPDGMIGTQRWMSKNLDVTTFNDGTPITQTTNNAVWSPNSSPAWIYNNLDAANNQVYGKLYNWAVINNTLNICPVQYHVPTYADWLELQNFLGGTPVNYIVAGGGKLKQTGTSAWTTPNTGATNSTKFNAVGNGYIGSANSFSNSLNNYALFWSQTLTGSKAYFAQLSNSDNNLAVSPGLTTGGFAIRCIHD